MSDPISDRIQKNEEQYAVSIDTVKRLVETQRQDLRSNAFNTDWIRQTDRNAFRYASAAENGVDTLIKQLGQNENETDREIRLPPRHAMVWVGELRGQLSGGAWENYWGDESDTEPDEWEKYVEATVVVDPSIDGIETTNFPDNDLHVNDTVTLLAEQVGRMAFFMSAVETPDDATEVYRILDDFDDVL